MLFGERNLFALPVPDDGEVTAHPLPDALMDVLDLLGSEDRGGFARRALGEGTGALGVDVELGLATALEDQDMASQLDAVADLESRRLGAFPVEVETIG